MLEIHPPVYPLSREAFVASLATGHGRALIHAGRFGVEEFRSEILGASIKPMSYDIQVDGYREGWLATLCEAADLVGEIIVRKEAEDHIWQRCALLKQFFLNGRAEALPALYEMWSRHREGNDLPAVEELIELDGERGLRFVTGKLGELLATEDGFWVDGSELGMFDEVHGEGAAKSFLEREAVADPRIAGYLAGVARTLANPAPSQRRTSQQSVAEVIAEIRGATRRYPRFQRWGQKASEEDRRQVAELLGSADDPIVLAKVLSCFAGTGFPSFDPTLLGYLHHPDRDVRSEVVWALSHHDEEEVREAGLEAIRRGDGLDGLILLKSSARAEDVGEIFRAVEMPPGEDADFHSFVCATVRLLECNPAVGDVHLALWIYERSPCMHCRKSAVEIMIQRGFCPAWVVEECLYDGSEGVREIAAKGQT